MFSNKIAGCLFGYAIGDALGLGTEFMTRREAQRRYPDGLRTYDKIIRDVHRSQWRRGDFTADTQVVQLLLESIIENNCVDYRDFARRYKELYLQNVAGTDIGAHIRLVLTHPGFDQDPQAAARDVYNTQQHYEARNESLGRALFIGLWPENVQQNVIDNCLTTHPDPRCVASSVIIARMANELLWHRREADYDLLIGIAKRLDDRVIPYLETARHGTLDDFELDDDETSWYARKSMGAALWSLWHHSDPEEALYEMVDYAGDADTNASLAIALMGLKYGLSSLPKPLIDTLLERDAIADLAARITPVLQNADKSKDTDE